jgi:hypothetical protein
VTVSVHRGRGPLTGLGSLPRTSPGDLLLDRHSRRRGAGRTAARGLPVGLAVTLPLVMVAIGPSFASELLESVRFLVNMTLLWLLVGTTVGLVIGLQRFVSSEDAAQRSTSPAGSYRGDRARALIELLGTGLALVLARATFDGPDVVLLFVSVPATAVAIGFVIGLARDAWPLFILASTRRALRRQLPRPPAEGATRRPGTTAVHPRRRRPSSRWTVLPCARRRALH